MFSRNSSTNQLRWIHETPGTVTFRRLRRGEGVVKTEIIRNPNDIAKLVLYMVGFFWKKSEMPVASSLPEALQKFRSFNLSWCCLHMKNVSLSDKEHWYTPVCPECRVVPLKGEALVMVGSDAADALWYDFLCIFTGVVSPTMLKVPSIDAVFE